MSKTDQGDTDDDLTIDDATSLCDGNSEATEDLQTMEIQLKKLRMDAVSLEDSVVQSYKATISKQKTEMREMADKLDLFGRQLAEIKSEKDYLVRAHTKEARLRMAAESEVKKQKKQYETQLEKMKETLEVERQNAKELLEKRRALLSKLQELETNDNPSESGAEQGAAHHINRTKFVLQPVLKFQAETDTVL
jgi:chromosome segregation ATPase